MQDGELLRVALLIQLSPSPSSRTSSTLLGLLSSPRFSGLVTRCLSSRARWPGPARGPVCRGTGQWNSETTSVGDKRDGPGAAYLRGPSGSMNIKGVA
ncbi:hypothetical protein DPMN_157654 [Dreissena polymorpha]|uniref:Uncharacterized protein n=1 Tax=Dreissena polymorpha TaxID=45954 RepID=A0A9D4EJV1_DREPO|nr:hypothetical protein DPMN_157654 [Dreissena polymorpha]